MNPDFSTPGAVYLHFAIILQILNVFIFVYPFSGALLYIINGVTLVLIILTPISTYTDIKFIREKTTWDPSKLYYISIIPGIIGPVTIALYLYKRHRVFKNA